MARPLSPDLPILEPADLPEADGLRTVLITGAAGNIGAKLRKAWAGRYDLILLDQEHGGDPDVTRANLDTWDEEWAMLFEEADVVIHLAANPSEFTPWPDLVGPNLDAVCNVFHAAALGGVQRLIYASSNHAMGGYRSEEKQLPLDEDLPPLPGNPYGAAKLFGERLGMTLSACYGLEFIGLRIGWVQAGENRFETLPDDWSRGLWLSNEDMVRLFTCAVEAELPAHAVIINGVSNNKDSRWPLDRARSILGYEPGSRS